MFDVGFAELFLLGLIGLLVLGPERLPAVARTVGGFMRKARASWTSLRSTIEAELAEADIAAPIKEAGEELRRIGADLKSDLPDMNKIIDSKPSTDKANTPDQTAIENKTDSDVPASDHNEPVGDNNEPVTGSKTPDSGNSETGDSGDTIEDAIAQDSTAQPGHSNK